MKRPSLWLPVAGIAVQMAALGIASWAMRSRGPLALPSADASPPRAFGEKDAGWSPTAMEPELSATPPPPSPAPPPTAWSPADPDAPLATNLHADVAQTPDTPLDEPPVDEVPAAMPASEVATSESPAAEMLADEAPLDQAPAAVEPPSPFILELAERATQTKRARAKAGWIFFGFTPDANVRMVDLDGGRYLGKAQSARAMMVEDDGPRRFEIELLMHADSTMHVRFEGGAHDGETLELEPLVERPLA